MCDQNIHILNISEYFVDYNFVNQNTHTLNIFGNRVIKMSQILTNVNLTFQF
jgi:hypothetical protein